MLNDIDFFAAKLGKLDGFGDTGEFLERIIKAKKVEVEAPPANSSAPEPKEDKPEEEAEKKSEEPAKDNEKK